MAANPIKRLAGETAIYGMGTIVPRLLNYFLVPFYTRIFDQDAYGQITELYAWVAIVMVVLTYGMETSFFRYANKNKDPKKVFNTATSSLLITSLLFIFLCDVFGDVLLGVVGPHLLLVDVFLKDVTEDVGVDLVFLGLCGGGPLARRAMHGVQNPIPLIQLVY